MLQRDYEEFKVRMNALVAKAQKTPEEGWIMQDGTAWPGNNPRDHPGMIQVGSLCRFMSLRIHKEIFSCHITLNLQPPQVFLGHSGAYDIEGNELPRLVYVSREKRPGYPHHKKAGAENALVCIHTLRVRIQRHKALKFHLNLNDLLDTGKGVSSSHKCPIHPQS